MRARTHTPGTAISTRENKMLCKKGKENIILCKKGKASVVHRDSAVNSVREHRYANSELQSPNSALGLFVLRGWEGKKCKPMKLGDDSWGRTAGGCQRTDSSSREGQPRESTKRSRSPCWETGKEMLKNVGSLCCPGAPGEQRMLRRSSCFA